MMVCGSVFNDIIAYLVYTNDRTGHFLLRLKPLRFLGRISYSLYLFHYPLILALNSLIAIYWRSFLQIALRHPLLGQTFDVAIVVPLAILIASAVYRFVEKPMIEKGRALTAKLSFPGQAVQAADLLK